MWWPKVWCLAAGVAGFACTPAPLPPRPASSLPALPAVAAARAAPWPDVSGDAQAEKSGARDAVLVVAVERNPPLPDLPGVHISGDEWTRFFPTVLGVPPERVTALFDAAATRSAISSAVQATAARVAPGGRLWLVAIGHTLVDETDVASAGARPDVQVISIFDVVPRGVAAPPPLALAPTRPGALLPITFSIARPVPLPGASRSAFSYLLMGALRGWGDADHDGRVTASEAAAYVDLTLRLLAARGSARPSITVSTDLVCSELTTLSVAREPAPNILEIAPRVPPGPPADPERLASAREAVRAADGQLAAARASGSLEGTAELPEVRFIGTGNERRVERVPMPPEVEVTLRVRLEQAKHLGGPAVPEAARLLVEAGRLSLAYGRVEEVKDILTPVMEARCGADAVGQEAWQLLWAVAGYTGDRKGAARLASLDCAYDEASASAIDALFHPVLQSDSHNRTARLLYSRAEQEGDAPPSRCTWSAVAEQYGASWWGDQDHGSQVEAAFNGAYAYRKLGQTDEAVALYRSYVRKHALPKKEERPLDAKARRAYAVAGCASYLALAKAEPRHFPGYFETCKNVDCTGLSHATCAELTANADVARLGAIPGSEAERARQLTLAARDREELAGWEATELARAGRLREASEQYASAEAAWAAIVAGPTATLDPSEAARGLAEATLRQVVLSIEAGAEATHESIEKARQLARWARDVSTDERRTEPARLLVELADALLAHEQRAFAASQGSRGVAPRAEVRFEGEHDQRHFVKDELPTAVSAAIAARDEYLAHVPATFDASEVRYQMAYEAGRLLFLYGHFAEARQRLELPYAMACGLRPVAHEAWLLLLSIANLELDMTRLRTLAADTGVCASDVETRLAADRLRKPVRSIPFVFEARRRWEASTALPDGPARLAMRRDAAASFRQFVLESPDRDEAPEAARLGAELYAELGENTRALEMRRFFVEHYAKETRVRVADLERAYAALATLHARRGDSRAQALVLVEQSQQKRLPANSRAAAARRARELRAHRDGRGVGASGHL